MIDARRLRVLREVAEQGTLAAAADALHLTPSAVSQQLAALEREVGQPVIERNGRGVRLTGAAEVLVGHANVVLAQLEAAAADVAAYSEGVVGTVRIAGFATALAELVAPAAAALRASHPAARADDRRAGGARLLRRARARRRRHRDLDGVAAQAPPQRRPALPPRARCARDALDAVLPADHPLAARAEIDLAELAAEPFVGPPDGTSCHDVTVSGCAAAGFTPAFEHWSLDFYTTMALVAAGLGVALVPRLAQAAVPAGAVVRPLRAPAPARHVFAATRAGAERRPTVAAVLAALLPARPPTPNRAARWVRVTGMPAIRVSASSSPSTPTGRDAAGLVRGRGARRRLPVQLGPLLPASRRPRRQALRGPDRARRDGGGDRARRARLAGDLQQLPQPRLPRRRDTARSTTSPAGARSSASARAGSAARLRRVRLRVRHGRQRDRPRWSRRCRGSSARLAGSTRRRCATASRS